ncbi:hypothetical protein H0H81_004149 [Sphagnurus paluster]|uniref:Uncharacterized protein n=1 Tax=Sphagnurus paluster TaxID=117069 RepID=A0A9P7KEQ7_9AGAR|nr:hypothetical protein H0H81_004149 [Sphagnurus paluster]
MATMVLHSLPGYIWNSAHPWLPPTEEVLYTRSDWTEKIYQQSSGPHPDLLTVQGDSLDALAKSYCSEIDTALRRNDFTTVLSSNRLFSRQIEGSRSSFGEGIENEVLFHLFKTQILDKTAQFLVERAEGLSTLHTMTSFVLARRSESHPNQRTMDMKRFGAICALMIARGQMPSPLSPAVILFIIYDFDLACLTPSFIGYWYPVLRKMIDDWLLLGPAGNPATNRAYFDSHFISYHDCPVAAFGEQRHPDDHQAIAAEMLYKGTLGQSSYRHPDWTAFMEGFDLPCRNGFSFKKALRSFEGGPEKFLALIGNSRIYGPESLDSYLFVATSCLPDLDHLRQLLNNPGLEPLDLIQKFIKGQGIPCPLEFDALKDSFENVDLSEIDTPAFRSRILVWAITGSPILNATSGHIKVCF